jgi:hypothetical protein
MFWTTGSIYIIFRDSLAKFLDELVSSCPGRWIQLGRMRSNPVGEETSVGRPQGPHGGAMVGLVPSSPEFIDTVTPGIIEQKEGMGR